MVHGENQDMSKESERVVFHEAKGDETGPMRFVRVDIRYADGELFYSGWIQDFGDGRTGPTFFPQNYTNYDLDREVVYRRALYWESREFKLEDVVLRDATEADFDAIVDLNFQNYFEGGYNRISAYQGMNYKIDVTNSIVVAVIGETIFGFLCINWARNTELNEAYFDSLFCAKAVRNKGVADKLVEAGLIRAQERGIRRVSGQIDGNYDHCEQIARMLMKHGFEVLEGVEKGPGWIEVEVLRTF
jgi:GNAT superfamily N-acetyltransferase